MEHSTSLRFLEASGRPSGTGRPSLPAPRADRRPEAEATAAADEPKRFERVLDDARAEPGEEQGKPARSKPGAKPSADESRAAQAPADGKVLEPAEGALPAGALPQTPVEPADQDGAEPPAPISAAPNLQPRHAALALPAAPAPAAPLGSDAAGAATTPASTAPALDATSPASGGGPLESLTERAPSATRDGSLFAAPAPAPETRPDPAAAAATKPAPPMPESPADSGRAGEILRQLRVQLSPELRTATIQLSPPELGRISIRMRIEKGELHALVRAERRETLDALQRHVPELKATLEQAGIRARELDLQLGFEQRGAREDAQAARSGRSAGAGRDEEPELREAQLLRTLSARSGGIDTYA